MKKFLSIITAFVLLLAVGISLPTTASAGLNATVIVDSSSFGGQISEAAFRMGLTSLDGPSLLQKIIDELEGKT